MASGSVHDRTTCLLSLPYGLLWWPWLGPSGALGAGLAFLVGGLWLSPDLDTRSNATRRWGWLRWLWWPYRHGLSHRSLLSHSPLLGSGLRLGYLALWITLLSWLLQPLGTPSPAALGEGVALLWRQQRPLLLAALTGVEASSWLHLLQDGDPMPRLPRLLRHPRNRGRRQNQRRSRRR